jgi:hypothetical protein
MGQGASQNTEGGIDTMATAASPTTPPYPLTLTIDYPDRPLNRLTTFFRIFTVIPIAIILALVSGGSIDLRAMAGWTWQYGAGGGPVSAHPSHDPVPTEVPQVVV